MDANFSYSSTAAPAIPVGPLASGAAPDPLGEAGKALRGADFANLLGSLMADPQRQAFAAQSLADAGLQAVSLSPQMELITPAAPVPDAGSLMAFARTQGLDETTLAALFGDMAMVHAVPLAGLPATPVPVAGLALPTRVPVGVGVGLGGADMVVHHRDAFRSSLDGVGVTGLAFQVSKPPADLLAGAIAAADVQPSTADEAVQDALRVQLLLPRDAIAALTRKLSSVAGSGQAVPWSSLTAGVHPQAVSVPGQGVLNLRELFAANGGSEAALNAALSDAEGQEGVLLPGADVGRSAASSLLLTPEGAPAPSQAGQRAEHYQQLADRLGQALAQRLQAQIERGEWKLQMRMDPASLGRIDMELEMHAGGLDAIFRSDNAVTRELIAQGLPKLRDSLAQSGMAVASTWVGGDSSRQSGGNPTPSQTPDDRPRPSPARADVSAAPAVATAQAVGQRGGASGDWDVLA